MVEKGQGNLIDDSSTRTCFCRRQFKPYFLSGALKCQARLPGQNAALKKKCQHALFEANKSLQPDYNAGLADRLYINFQHAWPRFFGEWATMCQIAECQMCSCGRRKLVSDSASRGHGAKSYPHVDLKQKRQPLAKKKHRFEGSSPCQKIRSC